MVEPAFKHWLICGVSQTGKSTAMRRLSRESRRRLIVYDPTGMYKNDPRKNRIDGWRADLAGVVETINPFVESPRNTDIFRTEMDFMDAAEKATDADLFIDEAQDVFAQRLMHNHWLMTQGRHRGLQLYVASQRPTLIAPSVRTQVAVIICYRLARDDLRQMLASAGLSIKRLPEDAFPIQVGEHLRVDMAQARFRFMRENVNGDITHERELQWIC